jgi:hypothetical protein
MAFNLESVSSARKIRAPRIVLLGTAGVGKSEFASGAPDCIFAPVLGEDGLDALDVKSFPVVEKFEDLMSIIDTLCGEHTFKTVVIDSTTAFAKLVDDEALRVEKIEDKSKLGGGWGHQWDTILELWQKVLTGLDYLRNEKGMTIVLIGHVKIKASRLPGIESFDQWVWDIDSKVSDLIIRWADSVLFMDRKVTVSKSDAAAFGKKEKRGIDTTGGRRWLFTQQTPTHPGKARGFFGKLPEELALPRTKAWETFENAIAGAIDSKLQEEGQE